MWGYFMKTVKTIIGNTNVLIKALDDDLFSEVDVINDGSLRNTTKTGIKDDLKNSFEKAKTTIFEMVNSFENELEKRDKRPSEFSLEFTLSLSTKSDIWIIGCESNTGLKVNLKWIAQ